MLNDPTRETFLSRNGRLLRWLAIIALAVGSCELLSMVTGALERVDTGLLLIVFATLFAYAVYPPIRWLTKRGVQVGIASTLVYAALFLVIVAGLAWLTPTVIAQTTELTHSYPSIVAQAQRQINDPASSPLLQHFPPAVRTQIAAKAGSAGSLLGQFASGFGAKTLALLAGATAFVANFAVVLGLASLFISDLADIQRFFLRIVPISARSGAVSFLREVDGVVGGFVRGQLVIAAGIAVVASIILFVTGVPFGVLLGILAAIINIVPIIGAFIALVPIAFVALFTVGWLKALIAVVLVFVVFQVQQQVLNPFFVARTVGVTPLVLFLALILGSEAYGILGTLLAIPVAGILRVAADRVFPDNVTKEQAATALDGPATN